ncbi:MAG: rhodanese-related sulfurtransferase [Methylophagaceae bacterium]|jgi:rhodanese-related sulfurtransferase
MENFSELAASYWWLGLILAGGILAAKKLGKAFGGETVEIKVEQVVQLIEQQQALLIDLAEKTTFEKGHIPGAINMPGITFIDGTADLEEVSKPVILLPMKGLIPMPVVQYLDSIGVKEIYLFKGGLKEWQEAGLPN